MRGDQGQCGYARISKERGMIDVRQARILMARGGARNF